MADLRRKDWLKFNEAVEVLRPGEKLRRISWETGKYLSVDFKLNILYLTKPDSIYQVKYLLSTNDSLACDWQIFCLLEKYEYYYTP